MYQSYVTHDNGNRPYLVKINKKSVQIFKRDKSKRFQSPVENDYQIMIKDYKKVNDIFIGKIPSIKYEKNPIKSFFGFKPKKIKLSKSYRELFLGNTILIKIRKYEYLFIESCIYEIKITDDQIINFISPVGNNDVPYPIGYGKKYVYFLTSGFHERMDKKIIPKELLKVDNCEALTDFYLKKRKISSFEKIKDITCLD